MLVKFLIFIFYNIHDSNISLENSIYSLLKLLIEKTLHILLILDILQTNVCTICNKRWCTVTLIFLLPKHNQCRLVTFQILLFYIILYIYIYIYIYLYFSINHWNTYIHRESQSYLQIYTITVKPKLT
jgi:hypothetical protein